MATITRTDSIPQTITTPTLSSKSLSINGASAQKPTKPAISAPRIDIEPLYTALKSAIGDKDWVIYKEAVSLFLLGNLNQVELSRQIDRFICVDTTRENLHNQFICGIYGNAFRDAPEPGVASWVSANDKPMAVSKTVAGDGAEQRLKTEVMQLPARERRRLKQITEVPFDMFTRTVNDYAAARIIRAPDAVPMSAGGYNKTNWDLEIRKRYAQPLFQETNEFPDKESINARMIPICYEEGVVNGAATGCDEFLNIATETYIKEILSNFLSHVSSNGEDWIKTASYKRQWEKEDRLASRGEIQRNAAGLLPVEVEALAKRRPLTMVDLKFAVELGDSYIGQVPLIAAQIINAGYSDGEEYRDDEEPLEIEPKINGAHPVNEIISHGIAAEEMYSWQGGAVSDIKSLDSMLDDCLAIGQ